MSKSKPSAGKVSKNNREGRKGAKEFLYFEQKVKPSVFLTSLGNFVGAEFESGDPVRDKAGEYVTWKQVVRLNNQTNISS